MTLHKITIIITKLAIAWASKVSFILCILFLYYAYCFNIMHTVFTCIMHTVAVKPFHSAVKYYTETHDSLFKDIYSPKTTKLLTTL